MKNANEYLPEDILIPFFGDAPIVGVEIGVMGASGTVAMLNRMPNLKLYAVDPFKHFWGKGFEAERDQAWHDENFEHAQRRVEEFDGRCIIVRMKSDQAARLIFERLDFVYIDGDHNEDQVRRDIRNWLPKLKPRAILAGHDSQIDYIRKIVRKEVGEYLDGDDFIWFKRFE